MASDALAVPAAVIGKIATGHVAGRLGGFSARQSFNAGVALIAHGEFTIILAQVASQNDELLADQGTARRPAARTGTGKPSTCRGVGASCRGVHAVLSIRLLRYPHSQSAGLRR